MKEKKYIPEKKLSKNVEQYNSQQMIPVVVSFSVLA